MYRWKEVHDAIADKFIVFNEPSIAQVLTVIKYAKKLHNFSKNDLELSFGNECVRFAGL